MTEVVQIPAAILLTLLVSSAACAQEEVQADAPRASPTGFFQLPSFSSDSDPPEWREDVVSTDRPYWRQNLFARFFRDQKFLFTTWWPSEFRRPGFTMPLLAGALLATTSYRTDGEQQDLQLGSYIKNEGRGRAAGPARTLSSLGDAGTGAFLIGSGYLIGRWSHNDRLAESCSLSAQALLSTGLWSSALKTITGRPRPGNGSEGRFFDYRPGANQTVGSFPSGHATGAFAVATVFSEVYKDHWWVSWVAYGTAGLIGTSRVSLCLHFPSDVIVAGLLGHSIGRMVVAHEHESGPSISTLRPFLDVAGERAGAVWTREW